MPNALTARVRRIVKPPHLVTVEETKTTKVFENGKLIDTKTEATSSRNEWRVVAVVDEDFGSEKEVTLVRKSEEEAASLVEGAVAYHF